MLLDSLPRAGLFNWRVILATKKPSPAKASEAAPRVTKIRATAPTKANTPNKPKTDSVKQSADLAAPRRRSLGAIVGPFVAIGGYFKGSWQELREVRWPNRRTTWSMTGALVGFTAFFVVLILLLDALFKYLFELILK